MKKILFVINPIAGVTQKFKLPELIRSTLNTQQFDIHIKVTDYAGHAKEITQSAVLQGFDTIVAVGGDGSVNDVASQLVGTNVVLGILPSGSGNGLARKLGLPINPKKALECINAYQTSAIDVGVLNGDYFFSNAGMGFEALIAEKFARIQKRGINSYAKLIAKNYFTYKGNDYLVTTNEGSFETKAFLINISNSGQYGYHVGPTPIYSDLSDGWLELYVMEEFARWRVLYLLILLLMGKIKWARQTQIKRVKKATIQSKQASWTQIDGDAINETNFMDVEIKPKSLRVIVP